MFRGSGFKVSEKDAAGAQFPRFRVLVLEGLGGLNTSWRRV